MICSVHAHRYVESNATFTGDPLSAAARLAAAGVFDNYVVTERQGRYLIGGDVLAELRVDNGELSRTFDGHTTRWRQDGTLRQLAAALAELPIADWRAFGWIAFEFGRAFVGLPTGDTPLAHVIVPRVDVQLAAGVAVIRAIDPADIEAVAQVLAEPDEDASAWGPSVPVDLSVGAAHYRDAVRAAVEEINSTALQKVIVSRVVPVDAEVDLVRTYVRGRTANTPARSFLLDLGGTRATGFSPEIVVTADGEDVVTQPLAGTRALSHQPERDLALREELLTDAKEIYEHAVSVKAAFDELTEVCEPASVRVENFMRVCERGSVQHLGSAVRGRLTGDYGVWDALQAVFPPVTASGIPKAPAFDSISRLETEPRGLYSGVVLTADSTGAMDAALTLRTVFQTEHRTWLRAGAGIVEQSKPDREFEETCEKLRSVSGYLVPVQAREFVSAGSAVASES